MSRTEATMPRRPTGRRAPSLALAALCLANAGCFRSTEATEVAIRIGKLFGADRVVDPGTMVLVLPFIHDWYAYDTKTQSLQMKVEGGTSDDAAGDQLQFKTRDGNDIDVDMTTLYHVDPQRAPAVLRMVAQSMEDVRDLVVRPLARSIPRDALNELSSEEFYASDLRAQKEDLALANLTKALAAYGIVCERVVLGNYRFHPNYQEAIDAKKVADQAVNKNRSGAEAAIKEWQRELEKTRGQVGQQIASEKGKAQQVHLQADAYFSAKQLEAEAILAEKTASAKGIEKMRTAMAAAGGRTMVKLEIAKALKGKRIVLFPSSAGALGVQTTDVNRFLETMGLKSVVQGATAGAARRHRGRDAMSDLWEEIAFGVAFFFVAAWLYLDRKRGLRRLTWKGAFLMTWRQVPPLGTILKARKRRDVDRRAAAALASIGFEPPPPAVAAGKVARDAPPPPSFPLGHPLTMG